MLPAKEKSVYSCVVPTIRQMGCPAARTDDLSRHSLTALFSTPPSLPPSFPTPQAERIVSVQCRRWVGFFPGQEKNGKINVYGCYDRVGGGGGRINYSLWQTHTRKRCPVSTVLFFSGPLKPLEQMALYFRMNLLLTIFVSYLWPLDISKIDLSIR